ncbi:MAG: acyltransferase [Chlorobi bacterium]|nr:acyltransferase [Chlorobiota bacterium]
MDFFKRLCAVWFKLKGWRAVGEIPSHIKKGVIIGPGHTSNWDFVYTMGAMHLLNINAKFTIKKEWFFFPMNLFFKSIGGIPVDRQGKGENRESLTDAMARLLREAEELFILVTVEGTRKKVDRWRTGFYYTALKAQVPILVGFLDYAKKEAGIKGIVYPTGDYKSDVKKIVSMLRGVTAKYPEKACLNPRLDD